MDPDADPVDLPAVFGVSWKPAVLPPADDPAAALNGNVSFNVTLGYSRQGGETKIEGFPVIAQDALFTDAFRRVNWRAVVVPADGKNQDLAFACDFRLNPRPTALNYSSVPAGVNAGLTLGAFSTRKQDPAAFEVAQKSVTRIVPTPVTPVAPPPKNIESAADGTAREWLMQNVVARAFARLMNVGMDAVAPLSDDSGLVWIFTTPARTREARDGFVLDPTQDDIDFAVSELPVTTNNATYLKFERGENPDQMFADAAVALLMLSQRVAGA